MSAQPARRVPIETDGSVDLGQIDGGVLKQFEKTAVAPWHCAAGDGERQIDVAGEPAITINVSALPNDAQGTADRNGVGLWVHWHRRRQRHADARHRHGAVMGPDGNASSIPAWAKETTALHDSGDTKMLPMLFSGVAPEYAALTFDQRMALMAAG